MILTTGTGDTLQGFCMSVDVNEVATRTLDQKIVKIAKNNVSRLMLPKRH